MQGGYLRWLRAGHICELTLGKLLGTLLGARDGQRDMPDDGRVDQYGCGRDAGGVRFSLSGR